MHSLIVEVRGQKAILDFDLARIYGVPTKRLNEQVKRNAPVPVGFPVSVDRPRGGGMPAFKVANCDLEARTEHQIPPLCLHRTWRHYGREHPQQFPGY
jgi:hypothetical protein